MSKLPSLAAVVLAALASGCAVGPDYHRPDAPLPAHYLGTASHRPDATALPAAQLAAWWDGFNDPLLARYVSLALGQNLDLAQAAARVTQARAGLGAANAALLPAGSVTSSAARA